MYTIEEISAALRQVAALNARGFIGDPAYELVVDDIMTRHNAKADRNTTPAGAKSIKFRDPANPANTWTGLGRRPLWLNARLKAGATLDEFRV